MDGSETSRTERRGRRKTGRAVRLRRWLLGGAVVLLAVLAGLIGSARHRARAALLDLPHRLGIDIKSETDGFTISRSEKGRTLFTIHAAKAIQHRDGKTTLRNVAVTLYGEPGTNRVDLIRGAEFEYDQANGMVRALGESEIDLAAPAQGSAEKPNAKRIHVTANGLVFDQKLGTAGTQEQIRFEYGAVHGSARGAVFGAHTGSLQLQHEVHVVDADSPQTQQIDADSATLDRQQRTAMLRRATVTQAGESMRAQNLLVRLRPEAAGSGNSIESVHGTGGVELRSADGAVADAPTLDASLSPQNRLREANMTGGVTMRSDEGEGHSATATVLFDDRGRATRFRMAQAVNLQQNDAGASTRQLTADVVDGTFASNAKGRAVLQQSVATGHAMLHLVDAASMGKPVKDTTLAAQTLHAFGAQSGERWQVRRVVGDGATQVEERVAGEDRTSTGAHIEMLLAASGAPGTPAGSLESFVQQGHVHAVDRRSAAGTKAASESAADADRAEYLAGAGTVVLTGSPVVRDDTVEVAASRITIAVATGDADAVDAVKGSYRAKTGTSDPNGMLHFLADRMRTDRGAQQATLLGGAHPVRLWNQTSQIEAPVVDLDQAKGTLFAHDLSTGHAATPVHAVLPANASPSGKVGHAAGVIRILSETLRYHQETVATPAAADFIGAVRLDMSTGQVQCDHAAALLHEGAKTGAAGGLMGGTVETVTADGHVRVVQPGRLATGSRLVYTAASQQFVLTGSPAAPPVVRDSVQGTVTGTALLFHAGDDSVEVTGAPGEPVHTEMDAPPRNGTGRGKAAAAGSSSGKPAWAEKK